LFSDFYKAYYAAGQVLLTEGPRQIWYIAKPDLLAFVNIPILGYLFVPLALLEPTQAGWVYLGIGVAAVATLLAMFGAYFNLGPVKLGALAFLFAANGPLVNSLREGNTSHIVALLVAAAMILILSGWLFTGGAVLGLCALVKLPLCLFGIYYVLLRRWRIVAGATSIIASLGLLSLVVFGPEVNLGWYNKCVEPYLTGVVGAFNVQSIDAFLLRLAAGEVHLWDWDPIRISLAHRLVRTWVVGSMCGLALYLLLRAKRASQARTASDRETGAALEFVLILNLALVISPLSWTHYYLLLLLPAAVVLAGRVPAASDVATQFLIYGGLVLSAMPVVMPNLAELPFRALLARTVVSVWLLGGLLMLAGLMRAAWHHAPARSSIKATSLLR
jgi:Glycosyltransferase family 87